MDLRGGLLTKSPFRGRSALLARSPTPTELLIHSFVRSFISWERSVALPSRARATGFGCPRFSFPLTHPFHNAAIYLHLAFVAHGGPPLRGRVLRPVSEEASPRDQPPRSQKQKWRGTGTRPKTSTESEKSSHGRSNATSAGFLPLLRKRAGSRRR